MIFNTATTAKEFPMDPGQRILIREPNGVIHRYRVDKEISSKPKVHGLTLEVIKLPSRQQVASRATLFTSGRK